jgi:hypothetical protein
MCPRCDKRHIDKDLPVWFNERMSNNECNCGCGTTCKGRYAPGHDAKHKSRLIKQARSSDRYEAEAACREARALGWARYLDGDALMAVLQRNTAGRTTCHIDDVDMWFVDQAGGYHTHRKCAGIRGEIDRWTIRHARGWTICDTCTHTTTWLAEWENEEVRKAWSLHARRDPMVVHRTTVDGHALPHGSNARQAVGSRPPSTGRFAARV